MEDVRTPRKIDTTTRLRAKRGAAGLVAQYIHELSGASRAPQRTNGTAARTARRTAIPVSRPEPCTELT